MKLRNAFRIPVMVIGLGAALLLGGSVRAQELENTNWTDGPGVVPFAKQASPRVVATAKNSDSVTAPSTITQSVVTQAGVLPNPDNEWMMGVLLVCMALVALYAMTETRRRSRIFDARTGQNNGRGALQ